MSLFSKRTMFFYNNKTKKSLPGAQAFLFCPQKINKRETPQCTCKKGSLTVEATIILPLFACFFAFLLFYLRIMQVQLTVQNALEETGRNLAILAVKELEEPDEEVGYFGLAKGMLYVNLQENKVVEQYVSGGAMGVSLITSEFDGDYIVLNADYVMRFPIKLFGNQDFLICQKTRFRKWNGWHSIAEKGDESLWVYITEYGEAYHMRRSCPYLDLSIQKVSGAEVVKMRNLNGENYGKCERCGNEENRMVVYITNYGDKYHFSLDCGGLKRTIYQKKLSDVGGMHACLKCSK